MTTKYMAYLIPTLFTIYGFLTINGIKIPRIPLEYGYTWLCSGLFLYFLVLFGHIRAIRRKKKEFKAENNDHVLQDKNVKENVSLDEETNELKTQTLICKWIVFIFLGYIALYYINFPYTNDFIFMLITGSIVYCSYKLLEKVKSKEDISNDLDK